ncbi:MAG: outer membrane lipoprotein chaperone LolA [Arsenophonus sp.]|nr:MAG: outer membrane lipoprotein chaperone LolA [Arsenophonus sp.]
MKIKKIILLFYIILYIKPIFSSNLPSLELQKRLEKINGFCGKFNQKIIDQSGLNIEESQGNIWMKNTNTFKIQTIYPEENLIISDSKNIYYYHPSLKQVTIILLSDLNLNTPFVLFTNHDKKNWEQYKINQNKNNFFLVPKLKNLNFKYFFITIQSNGKLEELGIVEQNGQKNIFIISHYKKIMLKKDLFKFNFKKNILIDDQRSKK